jgi:hypothetical protein
VSQEKWGKGSLEREYKGEEGLEGKGEFSRG